MPDCLLAFFFALCAALVLEAGGSDEGGSPPPAARTGVGEGAAISAIENIASVTNLITSLIMRASRFVIVPIVQTPPCLKHSRDVVPAKAETHNHQCQCVVRSTPSVTRRLWVP